MIDSKSPIVVKAKFLPSGVRPPARRPHGSDPKSAALPFAVTAAATRTFGPSIDNLPNGQLRRHIMTLTCRRKQPLYRWQGSRRPSDALLTTVMPYAWPMNYLVCLHYDQYDRRVPRGGPAPAPWPAPATAWPDGLRLFGDRRSSSSCCSRRGSSPGSRRRHPPKDCPWSDRSWSPRASPVFRLPRASSPCPPNGGTSTHGGGFWGSWPRAPSSGWHGSGWASCGSAVSPARRTWSCRRRRRGSSWRGCRRRRPSFSRRMSGCPAGTARRAERAAVGPVTLVAHAPLRHRPTNGERVDAHL